MSPLASEEPAAGGGAGRQPAGRGRPARPHRRLDRRRRDLEAVAGAGELRSHGGVLRRRERKGWAVGHDGVILHTGDGGDTWTLQLDGRSANELLVEPRRSARRAAEPAGAARTAARRSEALQGARRRQAVPRRLVRRRATTATSVGAYNLIFRTADGGKTWEPWFDRTDNPKFFNLYAIRPAAGGLYIAGEGGLVLKLDADAQRFKALAGAVQGQLLRRRRRRRPRCSCSACAATSFAATTAAGRGRRSMPGCRRSIVGGDDDRGRRDRCSPTQGGRVAASEDGGRTFTPVAAQATDAADRHRRRRRRPARAGRAARRRRRRDRGALTAHAPTRAQEHAMAAVTDDLDQMPVVRELADFDRELGQPARTPGLQQPAGDGRSSAPSSPSCWATSRRRSSC